MINYSDIDKKKKLDKVTSLLNNPQEKIFLYTPFFIQTLERIRNDLIEQLK